jgi:hypothetical protein
MDEQSPNNHTIVLWEISWPSVLEFGLGDIEISS